MALTFKVVVLTDGHCKKDGQHEGLQFVRLIYFTSLVDWTTAPRPIVMVSGCYDLLHSGHVAFFADASQYGNVYVSVGCNNP